MAIEAPATQPVGYSMSLDVWFTHAYGDCYFACGPYFPLQLVSGRRLRSWTSFGARYHNVPPMPCALDGSLHPRWVNAPLVWQGDYA